MKRAGMGSSRHGHTSAGGMRRGSQGCAAGETVYAETVGGPQPPSRSTSPGTGGLRGEGRELLHCGPGAQRVWGDTQDRCQTCSQVTQVPSLRCQGPRLGGQGTNSPPRWREVAPWGGGWQSLVLLGEWPNHSNLCLFLNVSFQSLIKTQHWV